MRQAALGKNEVCPILSSGDLLACSRQAETPVGKAAKEFMDKGQLVPDKVLIDMFREKLTGTGMRPRLYSGWFPRNFAQAEALDEMLAGD